MNPTEFNRDGIIQAMHAMSSFLLHSGLSLPEIFIAVNALDKDYYFAMTTGKAPEHVECVDMLMNYATGIADSLSKEFVQT